MEDFSTDLEFAKAAYTTLKEYDPGRLELVTLLLAEGETPEMILEKMKEMRPDYIALPEICAGAAHWIVYQKNSN
jgi:predicted Fe-Mo cluster-binding NifX family protein